MNSRVNPQELKPDAFGKDELLADARSSDPPSIKQSRIISRVLSPAVRLWLRSQLEQVEDLQFTITAGDRQLLSGTIPGVTVAASKAVYQGLHLSQVEVSAENIRTNLRQVLQGQPLRLQASFPIQGTVFLQEADLNASLKSPLLRGGIVEFLLILLDAGLAAANLPLPPAEAVSLGETQLQIGSDRLTLATTLLANGWAPNPIILNTGFRLQNGNRLQLHHPQRLPFLGATEGVTIDSLDGYTFDLGSEVNLEQLQLENGRIFCRGRVNVNPA